MLSIRIEMVIFFFFLLLKSNISNFLFVYGAEAFDKVNMVHCLGLFGVLRLINSISVI